MPAKIGFVEKESDRALISIGRHRCLREFFGDLHDRVLKAAFQAAAERATRTAPGKVRDEDILTAMQSLLPEAAQDLKKTLQSAKTSHVKTRRAS
jgi:hypothetical protein